MSPEELREEVGKVWLPESVVNAISAAADAWERDREELEHERVRLAACGTAAIATVEGRITSDNPYYSASYADVCAAVDREMALRKRVKELDGLLRRAMEWGDYASLSGEPLEYSVRHCCGTPDFKLHRDTCEFIRALEAKE